MIIDMNIDHLKLFARIANTNNISVAGRELNISPAVASAHINKLEETLGVRLIHRTTRKVSLTDEGKVFLPHAEEVLTSIEVAQAAVGVGADTPQGTLRVPAPASFGRMHLVPAMDEFLSRYPDLNIDFRFSDSILDVVEGGFDVAIRNAELKDSNLHARKLAEDKRVIAASPDYIKKYGEPSSIHELKNHAAVNLTGLEEPFENGQWRSGSRRMYCGKRANINRHLVQLPLPERWAINSGAKRYPFSLPKCALGSLS